MKNFKLISTVFFGLFFFAAQGQHNLQPDLQNFRQPGFDGLNVFETPKLDSPAFEGLKVRLGADFAMQFQGLGHSTGSSTDTMAAIGNNFNLPTANLNLDVQMAKGVRLHMRTYLSSRHHPEAWVKGGHLQIDRLDFIKSDFLDGVMDYITVRVGMDEINYGDAHFRRTDNASAIYNPFVGNYIIDGFTTEAFGEVYFRSNGFLAMLAISNGKLNQSVVLSSDDQNTSPSFYGKLGYDKQFNDDFRFRITGSFYSNSSDLPNFLYNGDRASSRYYNVMNTTAGSSGDWSGRNTFTIPQVNSIMINPFIKYKGLEFFGLYENISGQNFGGLDEGYNQIAGELLYRFGSSEQLYVGGRYNVVTGTDGNTGRDINRLNIGGGWFVTNNILAKVEYVDQNYTGDGWTGQFQDGNFNGMVLEAVISF